jgi:hypothetical protein
MEYGACFIAFCDEVFEIASTDLRVDAFQIIGDFLTGQFYRL